MEYMVANRIPYAYGEQAKIADISGEVHPESQALSPRHQTPNLKL